MKLKDYIKQNDLSLTDFAREAGIPVCNVWRYVNGKRPSFKNFLAIKRATNGEVAEDDFV